jgi:hypothetical protein
VDVAELQQPDPGLAYKISSECGVEWGDRDEEAAAGKRGTHCAGFLHPRNGGRSGRWGADLQGGHDYTDNIGRFGLNFKFGGFGG